MRVIFYTRPSFLDTALPFIQSISKKIPHILFLELSPESYQNSIFEVSSLALPSGILPRSAVKNYLPSWMCNYLKDLDDFNLVVHNCPQSIHPVSFFLTQRVIKTIQRIHPDIVFLDDISLRLALCLPNIKNIPVILNIHDPEPHTGEKNWRKDLARFLTFHKVNHFILRTQWGKAVFSAKYNVPENKMDVIPLGALNIFHEWIEKNCPEEDKNILFWGRLSPYKGLDIFFKAILLITRKIPSVSVKIAGKPIQGYQLPPIPSLPSESRLEIILHYITNFQLVEFIQRSTLVVCPYLDATQSGVVLTAYAFNKPVIATTVGGLPEYVHHGKTGILVPPGDPYALAEAIIDLLQNPEKRRQMKKAIQQLAKTKFSWSRIAKQTVEVYEKVLKEYGH